MKSLTTFARTLIPSACLWISSAALASEPFEEGRLEREVLVSDVNDGIQLNVAPDGDVYFIERKGVLRRYSFKDKSARVVGCIPTAVGGEYGLIGLALDREFKRTQWVYVVYSPESLKGAEMRLSRFTLENDTLNATSEKVLLTYKIRGGHQGGGLQMDTNGDLWIGIADHATANVTPETDERPGRESYNALSTAANTQDLRGKILRIHPEPDGSYSIPKGNLFENPNDGRPEIYIMGCRNPYRFHFDSLTKTLLWGEVGSNTEERFGTGGYDEITRSSQPGNSGWPMFIGPNTPYRRFDHATNTLGESYDPLHPVNESQQNTGAKVLPKPIPALLWYGSENSDEFPILGNGGRSAMAGPVFHFRPDAKSEIQLPEIFDGHAFIFDWCRSWIHTISFGPDGRLAELRPFLKRETFRRPIELKIGEDGALYLLEFGEQWSANKDGQLSRIVYRRGNRPPKAVLKASVTAGLAPLQVRFTAEGSTDPDGDSLTYTWQFGENGASASGREANWTYTTNGIRQVTLSVTDSHGATHVASVALSIGNAPPVVTIQAPKNGSFFDWGTKIPFAIGVSDLEDGTTESGQIPEAQIQTIWTYREQPATAVGAIPQLGFEGGAALIRKSDCLSCHQLATPSIGPSYYQISERYRGDAKALDQLVEKVLKGGNTAWGEVPMPGHPQHSREEVVAMVQMILEQRPPAAGTTISGLRGELATVRGPAKTMHGKDSGGSYQLEVAYRDNGANGVPPITTSVKATLHARRTRAALFDAAKDVSVTEVSTLKRARRVCAQLGVGSYLIFKDVDLGTIQRVDVEVSAGAGNGGLLELHVDSPDGPLVGSVVISETGQWENWKTLPVGVKDPVGIHDLFVVAGAASGFETKRFNLDVLHFIPKESKKL